MPGEIFMRIPKFFWMVVVGIGLTCGVGCAVPQLRGAGLYTYVEEPSTKTWYHLYLPVDYVKNNGRHPTGRSSKWPLVMTFHGMKPYDNALPQEREWEKEADFYGYVVCAPELRSCDSFMEYPLTREHSYVLKDKSSVLAIMDHIFRTTQADPKRVLSTSWSCGGYLAHYFPNRFPNRFSCIATRLSNFSSSLMSEATVPQYKDRLPVAIFIGDGDFPACKVESEEAVAWYQTRGFRVRGKMIDNMGHRRIPQTAAAFFAEQIGIEPLHPADAAATVAQVAMTDYNPPGELLARFTPPRGIAAFNGSTFASAQPSRTETSRLTRPPVAPPTRVETPVRVEPPRTKQYVSANPGRAYPSDRAPSYNSLPQTVVTVKPAANPTAPPPKQAPAQTRVATAQPKQTNWLEPAKPAGAPALVSTPRSPSNVNKQPPPQQVAAKPKPAVEPQTRKSPPATARETQVASAAQNRNTPKPLPQSRTTQRDNTSRVPTLASNVSPSNSARGKPATSSNPPVQRSTTIARAPTKISPGSPKASRVNIRLSGPNIGTAPHYVAYSIDLPREKLDGADFLWMDNGVWIGDEPRGVKIIDTPGLHKISVLVVTKDDQEFRGAATVHVLDRGSTASAYRPSAGRTGTSN
jgi:dienelactone hydrolase